MQPMSQEQFQAAEAFRRPAPLQVYAAGSTEVWAVPLDMPGEGAMSYVFSTVIFGSDGVTVIDPGWPDQGTALEDFLSSRGRFVTGVSAVVATHAHPDHIGAAQPLAERAGARLVVGEREWASVERGEHRWFLPTRRPDVLLAEGDSLAGHGVAVDVDFEVVLTPGHTPGHVSLADRRRGIFIAADMILPQIFPGIGLGVGELGGNPIEDYLGSLHRLREFDAYLTIPGHGYCFRGLETRRRETGEHILQRGREVLAALEANPDATVREIASQLTWSLGWEKMQESRMLDSALRQTKMYRELVLRRPLNDWLD